MRAIVIERFGGAEELRLTQLATPEAKAGEVLIEVSSAGVNPVDWKIREGWLREMLPHRFPLIPGWDVAGIVRAVGAEVEGFGPGERVFTCCMKPIVQYGGYADYVVVEASAVAPAPRSLRLREAGGVPLAALTAWQALHEVARLARGQRVLVLAAAGGVGSFGVQIARNAGARVCGTARAENHDYVRGLGAAEVLDYTCEEHGRELAEAAGEGFDVVLDCTGGEALESAYAHTRGGGALVCLSNDPDPARAEATGIRASAMMVRPDGEALARIAALIDQGLLRVPETEVLPLESAAEAQERSRQGHVRGKLVLTVRG